VPASAIHVDSDTPGIHALSYRISIRRKGPGKGKVILKLTPYVHFKGWGAWGWGSRAGPEGGRGLGFEPCPKKLPIKLLIRCKLCIFNQ
jgi:hypothetical protein